MKQTAVEWFLNEFQKQVWFEENSELDLWIKDLIPKAKEMEKEQIMDAFNSGMNNSVDYFIPFLEPNDESENYYKETYESNT